MKIANRDEGGAALILALAFVMVSSLAITAILTFAQTGLQANTSLREEAQLRYSLDGAVEAAAQRIRDDFMSGRDMVGSECSDYFVDTPFGEVKVVCWSEDEAGIIGANENNIPRQTVLALSNASDAATFINTGPEYPMVIGGSVVTNGTFDVKFQGSNNQKKPSAKEVHLEGFLVASDCVGTAFVVQGRRHCQNPFGDDPHPQRPYGAAVDPGADGADLVTCESAYDPEVCDQPEPTNPAPSSVNATTCTLVPGTYSSTTGVPTALDLNGGPCKDSATVKLSAGAYYFDFPETTPWTIPPNKVVTGGCEDDGVSLIFGGGARLQVMANATFILCSPRHEDRQQIAIYGVARTTLGGSADGRVLANMSTGSDDFGTTHSKAKVIDGDPAISTVNSPIATHELTLSDFTDIGEGNPDNQVDALRVNIRHREAVTNNPMNQADTSNMSLTLTVKWHGVPIRTFATTPGGCDTTGQLCVYWDEGSNSKQTHSVDVTTEFLAAEHPPVIPDDPCGGEGEPECPDQRASDDKTLEDLQYISIDLSATSTGGPSGWRSRLHVDGMELSAQAARPLRAQSGCLVAASNPCPFISVNGGNGDFQVRGTVYAPLALLDLHLPPTHSAGISRGSISHRIKVTRMGAKDHPSIIKLEDLLSSDRDVYFEAWLDSKRMLWARVQYDRNAGERPSVRSWITYR